MTHISNKKINRYIQGDLLLICIRCFGQTCRQKPHQADKKRDGERVCVHVSLCTCKCLCTLQFVYQCIPTVLTLSGTESVLTVRAMQSCMEFIMTSFYILNKLKKINSNILLKSVLSFKSQYVREIKTMACAYFCTK